MNEILAVVVSSVVVPALDQCCSTTICVAYYYLPGEEMGLVLEDEDRKMVFESFDFELVLAGS